jgi:hypothetical protein
MLAKQSLTNEVSAQICQSLIDYATWPARREEERQAAAAFLKDFIPRGNDYLPVFVLAYEELVCAYFKTELCDLFSRLGRKEFIFHTKHLMNTSTSAHVRFHAAVALARLGFQDGFDHLEEAYIRNFCNPSDAEIVPEHAILGALRHSIRSTRALKLAQRLEFMPRPS